MTAPLYTSEQRQRRDATGWTTVQGILAPLQFLVFAVSLACVLRALTTGEGTGLALASVVFKTLILYAIMLAGAAWEKVVFGRWLFAPAFFWEDFVSIGVLSLHTLYVAALAGGWMGERALLVLALAAYASYAVNAAQYLLKFRLARRASATPAGLPA